MYALRFVRQVATSHGVVQRWQETNLDGTRCRQDCQVAYTSEPTQALTVQKARTLTFKTIETKFARA